MAEKRMFAKSIVLSDAFLDMPLSTRCLYFTLGMLADDDGFIGAPKSIMRQCGASQDDMNLLITKRFVLLFESGVIVIKHWRINNYLRNDRHTATTYLEEKSTLTLDGKGAYVEKSNAGGIPPGIPHGIPSIDKSSKEKCRLEVSSNDTVYKEEDYTSTDTPTICAEPEKSDSTPPIVSIVLNDGSFYPVSDPDYRQWCELFQAVDVLAELRKMVAWCDANPSKRKTKRGVKPFIVKWLSKAQDQGGSSPKYDRRSNSFQRHGDQLTPLAQRAIQEALAEGEGDT